MQQNEELAEFDWSSFLSKHDEDHTGEVPDSDLMIEGVLAENVDTLRSLDRYMFSIYCRAVKECIFYMRAYKRYLHTEYASNLIPRVRWREGRGVEMFWVRKIVVDSPATAKELTLYSKPTVAHGSITKIVKKRGLNYCRRYYFKYISKDGARNYSKRMFNKESGWVWWEGERLESCFALLREQVDAVLDLKKKINSIHNLNKKYFNLSRLTEYDYSSLGSPAEYVQSCASLVSNADENEVETSEG